MSQGRKEALGNFQRRIVTCNAQPGLNGGIMVLITGQLLMEGSAAILSFSQCFNLIPDGGSYYLLNDILKLVYPAS